MVIPNERGAKALRVLFVAAEADPLIKVGGLGDVTGSLPRALRALDPPDALGYRLDVRLAIPFHSAIRERVKEIELAAAFEVPHPDGPIQAHAFLTHVADLPVYLISGDPIPKGAPVYSLDTNKDGEKFTFFSLAVLELARALDWAPDILHANDWHTSLAPYMLRKRRETDPYLAETSSVLTVHNLPFMGAGTSDALEKYGIPPLDDDRLPTWGTYQPLPMGLATADYLTTVSPTYAHEILTPEFGCGLQDFLKMRSSTISGILNGLDESMWNPAADPAIKENYDRQSLEKRENNKQALIESAGLSYNPDSPLLILISRMDYQKGVDLAIEALHLVSGLPWQAVLLGTGDPSLEALARQLETEFPYRVKSVIRFDASFARQMYAGGDMLLMPSRYEPCGLAQMIAMRYGCIPVARATGGLSDTVIEASSPEESTGFLFNEATPEAMASTIRRAIAAFADKPGWKARQVFGMQQDFSWQRFAQAYVHIYHRLRIGAKVS